MDLVAAFTAEINKIPNAKALRFLLAVSGGIDSVVLCDLFHQLNLQFVIAHCNFQLRGEESERDEAFVRNVALQYGKEVYARKFETKQYAADNKLSTQVAARDLRYDWFRNLVKEQKLADRIVTAHHADDNIETVVMNFFRGTGLRGLVGMDTQFELIYRPLLHIRKDDIRIYAVEHQLAYVEDSSNATNNYTRNYFRNELLPAVQQVFPAAEENILKNISRLNEVHQVYEEAIKTSIAKLVETKGQEDFIPILKLQKISYHKTLLWELLKPKGFTAAQSDEVIKLFTSENGSFIESGSHRIIHNRRWLIISPKQIETTDAHIVIEKTQNKAVFPAGEIIIEKNLSPQHVSITPATAVALIDERHLQFPLLLRKAKQGDYFYPLGMQKKKKLSRFFIDQKLSPSQKQNMWVLESNQRVIWVVGLRLDDRFKITPTTSSIVRLTLQA